LYPPSLAIGRHLLGRISGLRPLVRRAALGAGLAALFLLALIAGSAEGPREAAAAHSGAGGALARALRRLGDLDRDGYSRLLGGGDCDDGDRAVHPGAREVPDDGVDNNCIGGDATARPQPPDPFHPVPPAVPRDLDVLLITIDTLRADHVGAYGYRRATTPRIDALAARGAVFENAWAHAPSTRYSIPAILTGRYPLEVEYVDIPREWPGLGEGNTTIAEVMKARGLTTSAVLNYWYFDKKRRMDQGFDRYDNTNKRLHKGIPGEGPARTSGTSAREQTAAAIAELDRITSGGADPSARFFLWVHYYDPHMDYERHAGTPGFGSGRVDLYDHEIRFTDTQVGALLDHLETIGRAERTAVVVTGDHGEGFGEHGIDLHGYHLYAPQTRVPLIVRVPGLPARRIALPAGHVDILPTLANLVGAEPVSGTMGRSLVDVLAGAPGPADRHVFQQLSYEGNHEMRGAASRGCHVIYNVSPDSSWEVYAIDKDPGETHDMSGAPGACAASVEALAAWYDQTEIPDGAAEALLAARPAIARPLDVDFGSARLLEVAGLDRPVRAGGSIPMTFTFEARGAPLAAGWKVFVHVEGRGRRFQGDHEPPRPPAWWRQGQFVRYTHPVPVPAGTPPGRYQVWVGLFRGSARHAARSASTPLDDDRALVGTIDVER
ncbi:MAG TPA: sulfatase-like hydrolase/transferase, partial [Kofleriaceae bacterium]|nr:sulfatase-like hydrolase/transferase [Kofleriaceae bacterium]